MKTLSFGILTHRAWSRAAVAAVVSLTAGCAWQDFDTVEETTWATSIDQPGAVGDSDTWATAVEPAGLNSFAVFGSGKASVVVMSLNEKGELNTINKDVQAKTYANAKVIELHASAPGGDSFAYLVGTSIGKWDGSKFEATEDAASGAETALAYGPTEVGTLLNKTVTLEGSQLKIAGAPACTIGGGPVVTMAMIGPGQLWIWYQSGAIDEVAPKVLSGNCGSKTIVNVGDDTKAKSGQIVVSARKAPAETRVYLGAFADAAIGATPTPGKIFSIIPGMPPSPVISVPGLNSIGLIRNGTEDLLAAGSSNEIIKGVNNAGQVSLYKGATLTDPVVLHDTQPTEGQNFGRGVVGIQIGGKPVVIVAAKDEIFAYFKTAAFAESRAK
jgi:hypothetical protein